MEKKEASALGGRTTYQRLGREHMRRISKLAALRRRTLFALGKAAEEAAKVVRPKKSCESCANFTGLICRTAQSIICHQSAFASWTPKEADNG